MISDSIAKISREAAADGAVLLKNENNTLPIINERVAVFGRYQIDYLKSGSGSGGSVNTENCMTPLEAFEAEPGIEVDREIAAMYRELIKKRPIRIHNAFLSDFKDLELEIENAAVKAAAARTDKAIVIIGRRLGEGFDNVPKPGGYYLSKNELRLIRQVSRYYKKFAVLLNCGNILDMSWVNKYKVPAVMYIWHGGGEGGKASADLISGKVAPSGRLSDTIAVSLKDYPSTDGFFKKKSVVYKEGIYTGYRHFETNASDKVLYPFGYGLSYTSFDISCTGYNINKNIISLYFNVRNTGNCSGKEVVELYINKPDTALDHPLRELAAFRKTRLINPGESESIDISFNIKDTASYDEERSAWIIESGKYIVYAGKNVRDAKEVLSFEVQKEKQLSKKLPPAALQSFTNKHYNEDFPTAVKNDHIKEFIAELTDNELCALVHGEGMNSRRVTSGTAAAFGGITRRLSKKGIPAACASDGPSGIRMDSGEKASLIPCGVCLACTWDIPLIEQLYAEEGKEVALNKIDMLLGPGMNLHRSPLCGRNFEYFSEDPYLTGTMAAAAVRGLMEHGIVGVIKHFAANNREKNRFDADSVIPERALHEIYLKSFEIAVKSSPVKAIMTSYNLVNGLHAASNPKLTTDILRAEWGFSGMVMTDWWAKCNSRGARSSRMKLAEMINAQNDIYMVVPNGMAGVWQDNLKKSLKNGKLTRAALERSAYNILSTIAQLRCMDK
ncbi:MAG: glycoside hydrolase family 3 C-terminal domain-containing protein [Oscillospiraceae bacterium]|nr:glycoside hydrolase family 3 C-terminal domain-containing protein [Oscillospiraceae bacterium]